jgi:amyloid beta precursor protein binding protein 1
MDAELVQGSDVGNNFFLERSSIGKSRAEEVTRYLVELNEDVKGVALVKVSRCTSYSGIVADEYWS